MNDQFEKNGYILLESFFSDDTLASIREILISFHAAWKKKYEKFYTEKAINSAYITKQGELDEAYRFALFQFLTSNKFAYVVRSIFIEPPIFMNTQLFFDPFNHGQKNYWHRDPQYHLSIDEQKAALSGPEVVHFRIPLFNEPGIELIPNTHKRWDSPHEQAVRLEECGHKSSENLGEGLSIELKAGDLLVFSANMIHRGLYGQDRLSLDVLFCDNHPDLMGFIDRDGYPKDDDYERLDNIWMFIQ
ncbi:phytanoyl-CoA dioxygenase family protein [Pseudomonas sp. HK3]